MYSIFTPFNSYDHQNDKFNVGVSFKNYLSMKSVFKLLKEGFVPVWMPPEKLIT